MKGLNTMPRLGLIALLGLTLLTGCAHLPQRSVITIPDYPPDFIDAVAQQYQDRVYGPETARAIDDWTVLIGG